MSDSVERERKARPQAEFSCGGVGRWHAHREGCSPYSYLCNILNSNSVNVEKTTRVSGQSNSMYEYMNVIFVLSL